MAFHDIRLPDKFAKGATGGPEHITDVIASKSRREQRNQVLVDPWGAWSIEHLIKTPTEMDTLVAFFRARGGRLHLFPFKPWADYIATDEPLGTGDAANKTFLLIKRYTSGGVNSDRKIYLPVAATFVVKLDGVPQGAGFTLNRDTTVPLAQADVTFTVAPGAGVAVTGSFEFDVAARFDVDAGAFRWDTVRSRSWTGIRLVERID